MLAGRWPAEKPHPELECTFKVKTYFLTHFVCVVCMHVCMCVFMCVCGQKVERKNLEKKFQMQCP